MNNREEFARLESRIDHLYQVIAEMLMDKKKEKEAPMEKETHVASENMKLFFEKLLDLKKFVSRELEITISNTINQSSSVPRGEHTLFVRKVYDQLDAIIKEKQ